MADDNEKFPGELLAKTFEGIPGVKVIHLGSAGGLKNALEQILGDLAPRTFSREEMAKEFNSFIGEYVARFVEFHMMKGADEEEILKAVHLALSHSIGFADHVISVVQPEWTEKSVTVREEMVKRGREHARQHDEEQDQHKCPPDVFKID